MTRSRRSFLNFTSGATLSAATLAISLVATPLLLRYLGEQHLGQWRMLTDWGGYLALLELGISGALGPLIARSFGSRPAVSCQDALSAGFRAYRAAAVLMLVAGAVLVGLAPFALKAPPHDAPAARLAAAILTLSTLTVLLAPLRPLLDAQQRGYQINRTLLSMLLVNTVAAVAAARAGWGVWGQALATLAGLIAFNAILWRLARRGVEADLYQLLRHPRPSAEASAALRKLNWPTFAYNVCGRVALLSDNLVIGLALSPAAVVPFFMTQRLVQIAQGQIQNVGGSVWAAMAELYHRGEHDVLRARMIEATRLTVTLSFAAIGPVVAYNFAFIARWVGPRQYGGDALTVLVGVNAVAWAVVSLWGWLISGTGRVALMLPQMIVGTTINLAISVGATWLLLRRTGDPTWVFLGPLLGTGAMLWLVGLPWMAAILHRHFGFSRRSIAWAVLKPSLPGIPFVVVIWTFARHVGRPWAASGFTPTSPGLLGWIALAAEMSMAAGVFLAIAWVVVLTKEDRALWRQRRKLFRGGR